MKILFSTVGADATGYQRILYPVQALKDAYKDVETDILNVTNLDQQLKWADIVVMQCLVGPQAFPVIEKIKASNKPLIVDYDDNFVALPKNILDLIGLSSEEAAANWEKYLKLADIITVATSSLEAIVNEIRGSATKAVVLPNCIRRSDYADSVSYNPWASKDDEVKILYSCSESHQEDIKYISGVLDWIATLYKNVTIISHGGLDFNFLNPKFTGKATHHGKTSYDSYLKFLRTVKPHIFIAPLIDSPHNRCRSDLKFLQSGLLKTAFLCSDLEPYSEVRHGITGFKAADRLRWAWYLRKLILDRPLAMSLGLNAYQATSGEILENHISKWYLTYKKAMETRVC